MRVDILGIGFDRVTLDGALRRAVSLLCDIRPHYIVTPNPEICYRAREDSELRQALNEADLVLPDGIGIVRASRKLGTPLPERVAGFDFAEALLPILAEHKKKLFLLGAKPGVAEKAAGELRKKVPGLDICGVNDGYFGDNKQILEKINISRADVVFVCLGSPKQERWMVSHIGQISATLMVGLGGCLDVWSGEVRRAPALFIRLGLEWLYRLLRQPSRLGRMMVLPKFMREVRKQRKSRKVGAI